MYLLHQLKTFWDEKNYNPKNIWIVSCNHNTRTDIDQEMELVKKYSGECNHIVSVYWGENKSEESLRKRRHQEFINICHKVKSMILLLWHHFNDRIETTLLNIERWCGIDGIQAFSVREQHFLDPSIHIIRPLINHTKQDILTECGYYKISYCVDPTNNDSTTSKRNALRIQLHQHINSSVIKSMHHLYEFLDNNWWNGSYDNQEKYQELSLKNGDSLVSICAGEWTSQDVYMLYKKYNITINPRSTTLDNLAQQLHKSWNSIQYQWLEIIAYKYGSVIKRI
jgi:tRNA(Ile)-lysidine synthetase-like protein